jgi:hypothetical protein
MSDFVISVENLGKRYRLGAGRSNERYTALRDVIAHSVSAPFRRLRNRRSNNLPATPKLGEGETSDFSISDFQHIRFS